MAYFSHRSAWGTLDNHVCGSGKIGGIPVRVTPRTTGNHSQTREKENKL